MSSIRAPLTDLESDVMQAVWDAGKCSVEDVYRVVSVRRDLKEDTVRTLLRRLEGKGYLTHEANGRAYIYMPCESPGRIAGRAVRQIIDRFCSGSLEQLVSGMVEDEIFSEQELARLEEIVRTRKAAK